MLDQNLLDQLSNAFEKLENTVELVALSSNHSKSDELNEMLQSVASTSKNIEFRKSEDISDYPEFFIRYDGKKNGIKFLGIPGGHEFTSFVLAILNSDQKGKLPDAFILDRMKLLKGPIELKTYISLSCETCPDVVQALNLITAIHPDITHQMIDGAFVEEDIKKLNIQGVPSIMHEGTLLHSGKISLIDLLTKLEEKFGKTESTDRSKTKSLGQYDVVIVGAGPAGVSSAIYTARKGLKTAIVSDRIGGQLQETKGIENFISLPYTEGPQLSAQLHKHMQEYDIDFLEHRRVTHVEKNELKKVTFDSGEELETKALIVATGAKWRELGVPGEKEYMGHGVAYCPHCDGPFYKGKDVAVVGGGNSGIEAAIDLAGIVKHVTVVEFAPELKADQVLIHKLEQMDNVSIVKNAQSTEVLGENGKVTHLVYKDRETEQEHRLELSGIFIQIGLIPNSEFIKETVKTNRFGEIEIDAKCRTDVPGIYAAGDVSTVPYKQIIISMGEGAKAGLSAFEDIAFH